MKDIPLKKPCRAFRVAIGDMLIAKPVRTSVETLVINDMVYDLLVLQLILKIITKNLESWRCAEGGECLGCNV